MNVSKRKESPASADLSQWPIESTTADDEKCTSHLNKSHEVQAINTEIRNFNVPQARTWGALISRGTNEY